MSPETGKSNLLLKILLHAVFFLSGIATVFIGPALPVLAAQFTLNDLQVSYFFPAQFSGSLFGTFLTYYFGKRNNFLTATLLGAFLMITGLSIMNSGSLPLCLLGFAINGTGIGLTLPSINMLILEMSADNAPSALNILNFFWGVGAIISTPFVSVLSKVGGIFWPTIIIAAALLIPAVLIFFMPRGDETKPCPQHRNARCRAPTDLDKPGGMGDRGVQFYPRRLRERNGRLAADLYRTH